MSEDKMPDLTPAQSEALDRATEILGEHFDRFVMACGVDTDDGKNSDSVFCYNGGFHAAIGLFEDAAHRMKNRSMEPVRSKGEEPDSEDE